jgi:Secretion system C-terminal sorting domain
LFNTESAGMADVIITNQQGSVVLSKSMAVTAGQNIKMLDVSRLPSGFYYVKLQNGSTVQMARIVISK